MALFIWLGCQQYGLNGERPDSGTIPEVKDTGEFVLGWGRPRPVVLDECVWMQNQELPDVTSTCQEVDNIDDWIIESNVIFNENITDELIDNAFGVYDLYFTNNELHSSIYGAHLDFELYRSWIIIHDSEIIFERDDFYNARSSVAESRTILNIDNNIYSFSNYHVSGDNNYSFYKYDHTNNQELYLAEMDMWDTGYGSCFYDEEKIYSSFGICDIDGNCTETEAGIESYQGAMFCQDLDLDGVPEFLNGNRIWRLDDFSYQQLTPIGNTRFAAPINVGGVGHAVYGVDSRIVLVFPDYSTQVIYDRLDTDLEQIPVAIGDVTGDGVADIVVWDGYSVHVVGTDGTLWERWRTTGHILVGSLADLNGDGVYEIISFNIGDLRTHAGGGVFVYDAQHHRLLLSDPTIYVSSLLNAPIIADVDEDGSMEIVVSGIDDQERVVVRTYGPATGRWARGRPVWNQYGYDITSVYDDGSLVPYPIPGWKAYSAYRAQPGHDGKRPDLQPRLLAACVPDCTSGLVQLAVSAHNTGAAEADSATLRLHTLQAGQWRVVAEVAVGRLGSMDGVSTVLTVEASQWGERQVLEIEGDEEECDRVNDRVEITFDLCAPPEDLAP